MKKNTLQLNKAVRGFTLVELLVVVAIIGGLASLVLVSFTGSQKQSRDTARKSDLRQYQSALESFANRNNGLYPYATSLNALCTSLSLSPCIQDTRNTQDPTFAYYYSSNGSPPDGTANASRYVLWAKLENTSDYWVNCSDGRTGAKSQTGWSNPSSGTCPL